MATDFHLELVVDSTSLRKGDSVLDEAHALVSTIENEISEYREGSAVYALNRADAGEWVGLSSHCLSVLNLSRQYRRSSRGYFDPFAKSADSVDSSDLEIDQAGNRFRRLNAKLHLGFGAIGKGYALDQVRTILEREGFQNYCLSSGGSSWVIAGTSPTGDPWTIAWAWRRDEDGDLAGRVLELRSVESIAIGVSGTMEQGNHFYFRGEKAAAQISSGFYGGRSAAEADAFSTALFVGASIEGEEILTTLSDKIRDPILAYVDLEEQIIYNQAFDTRFTLKRK